MKNLSNHAESIFIPTGLSILKNFILNLLFFFIPF
nr:MAG TPA: hypothetical protein [Bacteriophage sp.]